MTDFYSKEVLDTLLKLSKQVMELETKIENRDSCPEIRRKWIPKQEVMQFLGFGNTQMSAITKKHNLTTTSIGKRKFYHVDAVVKALEVNQNN